MGIAQFAKLGIFYWDGHLASLQQATEFNVLCCSNEHVLEIFEVTNQISL